MADFHQRFADDYYQDPLMGNRAVASFDIDQVVPPGKHRQLCGVGRVPLFQSKFNDVPAWVHPDFNLFSKEFLTKPKREGLRLPAPAVPALPPSSSPCFRGGGFFLGPALGRGEEEEETKGEPLFCCAHSSSSSRSFPRTIG